jgi:prolyl-tRNA editing enzyme YbaK/EbsC (Cys-tRNA(Pro) deacylase)
MRVVAQAEDHGLDIAPVRLDDGCRTAAYAAAAFGCAIGQILKPITFRVSGSNRRTLSLTSGNNRVNPAKACAVACVPLE